jgi:hypothetical protein
MKSGVGSQQEHRWRGRVVKEGEAEGQGQGQVALAAGNNCPLGRPSGEAVRAGARRYHELNLAMLELTSKGQFQGVDNRVKGTEQLFSTRRCELQRRCLLVGGVLSAKISSL